MAWIYVWVWVGGMASGLGLAMLINGFLERRITTFFDKEDDHERG